MKLLLSHLLFLVILQVFMQPVFAHTWHVLEDGSGDAPTVQAGIDSTASGDTVLVSPGVYIESIHFPGREIVLISAMGSMVTTIRGRQGSSVVTFSSGERRKTILEGFSITGGSWGITINDSEPTIQSNVIFENGSLRGRGGGITCSGTDETLIWSPFIANNRIHGNRAVYEGGGIAILGNMAPVIESNEILENACGERGGGIVFYGDGGALIQRNHIARNEAGFRGGGIWAAYYGSVGFGILQNIFEENHAGENNWDDDSGDAIWIGSYGGQVSNNTFVGDPGSGVVGIDGAFMTVWGNTLVERNIIAFSGPLGGIACKGSTSPTIRNNLLWGIPQDRQNTCNDWWDSNGNVIADPLFCDIDVGDFSVRTNSPALTHPSGPLGAIESPGCGTVPVLPTTWGQIKARYGN